MGRMTGADASDPTRVLRFGAYALDPLRHVLRRGDTEIALSPLASRLLQLLAAKPGEVIERAAIVEDLWRGDYLVGDPALTRVVSEIRSAVGDDKRKPTLIQTVPRRGYRLVSAPVAESPAASTQPDPHWRQAWMLANRTLTIVFTAFVVVFALAILSRLMR